MSEPLLRIEKLSAGYGEAVVLHGVSFALAEGQTLALLAGIALMLWISHYGHFTDPDGYDVRIMVEAFRLARGIATTAPAVAGLLHTVARLPDGMVVLPALDVGMPDEEWDALGPHQPDPETGKLIPDYPT